MKRPNQDTKLGLVVGIHPESYKVADVRLNKPVCLKKIEAGVETGSMLVQDIDYVKVKNSRLTYFAPNNVGILLSVSNKSLASAELIARERFDPLKVELDFETTTDDKKTFLNARSKNVCDYVEAIQISIIFGYTALESFANLSIPADYVYQVKIKTKGTVELYDKEAIERWIGLKDKILYILPDIYRTSKPDKMNYWSHFAKLEKYRHDIIHQKTINSTVFYKAYFRGDIFEVCRLAEHIIRFFYEQHAKANRTNPLWPWLINSKNYFPVSHQYDSSYFEVVGNLYEGYSKTQK